MHVYLIHAQTTNRYKIGITSRAIEYRLKELNGEQSAYPLELITSIRHTNYKAVEKHLHDRYKAYRVHGEWFEFAPEQLAEVQSYMSGFDTPTSMIKPILKNRPQVSTQNLQFSGIPFKGWILPLLLGLGLIYTIRQVEFFQSTSQPTRVEQRYR